jgi:hypothetical protein
VKGSFAALRQAVIAINLQAASSPVLTRTRRSAVDVTRIQDGELNEYIRFFRDYADEVEEPHLRAKLWQLASQLGPLSRKLAGQAEREYWAHKLDDLQGAASACETASEVPSVCHPFYVKLDRVISECAHRMAEEMPSAPA